MTGKFGESRREYLLNMVKLLTSCAEGGVAYVESFCQTLVSADDLLSLLNNRFVDIRHKAPIANYLVTGFLRSGRNAVQSGVDHLPHDR